MSRPGEPPAFETLADYFWPGRIDDCLRNRLGIYDATELERVEHELADVRLFELRDHAVSEGTFDLAHLQAVHRFLFQDVYEWAGRLRTVDAVKGTSLFTPPEQIEASAALVFGQLAGQDYLRHRSRDEFVDGLTTTLAAVNILHPFRDGNGRTMRAWSEQLAAQADHVIVWERLSPAEQNEVFTAAFELDPAPLRQALDRAVVATIRGGAVDPPKVKARGEVGADRRCDTRRRVRRGTLAGRRCRGAARPERTRRGVRTCAAVCRCGGAQSGGGQPLRGPARGGGVAAPSAVGRPSS